MGLTAEVGCTRARVESAPGSEGKFQRSGEGEGVGEVEVDAEVEEREGIRCKRGEWE